MDVAKSGVVLVGFTLFRVLFTCGTATRQQPRYGTDNYRRIELLFIFVLLFNIYFVLKVQCATTRHRITYLGRFRAVAPTGTI